MSVINISLPSVDGSTGFRIDGAASGDQSGFSVSNAGDINGDGFEDVIIGAPLADPNGNESGASYVVFGQAAGFDPTLALSSLDGSNGFRLNGAGTRDRSGKSVSSAGDVNGDGFDDLLVGARLTDQSGFIYDYQHSDGVGASYVVFGKASGFEPTLDLSALDGSNGFRMDGQSAYGASGHSVSSAGDVNGDGFADVIVGAPDPFAMLPEEEFARSGDSYVVFGKASGFNATVDLSTLDDSAGFHLDGVMGDHLGYSVSSAGDVNGDGFGDLIMGGSLLNTNYTSSGASYVVFGKASGFSGTLNLSTLDGSNGFRLDGGLLAYSALAHAVSNAGDINGDGFEDLIVGAADSNFSGTSYVLFGKADGFDATVDLAGLDGSNGFRLDGRLEPSGSRDHSVSNAGDVNGDGFDDLLVGLSGGSPNGSSYVIFGQASGFAATLDLATLEGSNGLRLDGITLLDKLGKSISSAGDMNGDGFDDLIVGAPGVNGNATGSDAGASYVIFGSSDFGNDGTHLGTPGDDILTGTLAADRFEAGDGNDMMLGHGGADVFHGGAGSDTMRIHSLDFELVDGGAGNDALGLCMSDASLNLANMIDRISDVEAINLYGTGNIVLALTPSDVLSMSDASNTLRVDGNVGDSVTGLSSGWVDGGIDGNFHTYTSDAAVLLVGVNLTTDFV